MLSLLFDDLEPPLIDSKKSSTSTTPVLHVLHTWNAEWDETTTQPTSKDHESSAENPSHVSSNRFNSRDHGFMTVSTLHLHRIWPKNHSCGYSDRSLNNMDIRWSSLLTRIWRRWHAFRLHNRVSFSQNNSELTFSEVNSDCYAV